MGNFTKGSWRLAVISEGALTPSAQDVGTTKTLIDAGKLLGVSIVDHIIVSLLLLYTLLAAP